MKYVGFIDLNIWWLGATGEPLATVKQQMLEDGYWNDCDMTDQKLEANVTVVGIPNELFDQLKSGYLSFPKDGLSDDQCVAAFDMLKHVATTNRVDC